LRKGRESSLDEKIEVVEMESLENRKTADVTPEMEAENEELSRLVTALKGEIVDLRASTSWRYTEPLRVCKKYFLWVLNRK
jgi:hypothetical protein